MDTKTLSIFEVLSEALDTIAEKAYMVLIGDEDEQTEGERK